MSTENLYNDLNDRTRKGIKKYIYDIVTTAIILAILAASLHVFGLTDFSKEDSFSDFLMDWLPFFAAAILLNSNLYQKGSFVGKTQDVYINVMKVYNAMVNKLTGKELEILPDFCDEYNDSALKRLQTEILKTEGISFEMFDNDFEKDDEICQSLKTLDYAILLEMYGERVAKVVKKAKNVKIKSITDNGLLSNNNVKDPTDLGKSEHDLTKLASAKSTVRYLVTTGFMSLIVINDLRTWGWVNLIVVLFKITFLLAKTFMSYYKGYHDITVNVTAHIARKTDVLKEFESWRIERNNSIIIEK